MPFRVRKFAAKLIGDPLENDSKFAEFFMYLQKNRAFKNYIIPIIISRSTTANFTKSGNQAAKRLYDHLKDEILVNLPNSFKMFKERVRRNAFFEVYDLIRGQWVCNGWLEQIISFLKSQPSEIQLQFLKNSLSIQVKHQILRQLQHQFSKKPAGFSIGYLNNLLQDLRNQIIHQPFFKQKIWQTMQTTQSNISIHENIIKVMQTGWIKQRNKQTYELLTSEIIPSLIKSYKIATKKVINRKYIDNPSVIEQRNILLDSIEQMEWDLDSICQDALQAEMGEWMLKHV